MSSNSDPQINLPSNYDGVGYPGNVPFSQLLPDLFLGYLQGAGGLDSTTSSNSPTNPAIAAALNNALSTAPSGSTGSTSMQVYLTLFFNLPKNLTTNFPSSIAEFINTYRNANGLASETETQLQSDPIYQAFESTFNTVLQLNGSNPDFTSGNETSTQLFEAAFDEFLSTYPVTSARSFTQAPASAQTTSSGAFINGNPSTPNPNAISDFVTAWTNYLTKIAVVQTQYADVYDAYFSSSGGTTSSAFVNTLDTFISKQEAANNGAFIPSQSYGAWLTYISTQYSQSVGGAGSTTSTIDDTDDNSNGPLILNKILSLLISVLNTVQNMAAAQANRLTFYTQWQQAYTDLLNQVRSFTENGPEGLTCGNVINNELNPQNQKYTSEIQARQQVVSDDAKSMQSTVQNSQSIAQQQGNTVTSLIQELQSILSTMYK